MSTVLIVAARIGLGRPMLIFTNLTLLALLLLTAREMGHLLMTQPHKLIELEEMINGAATILVGYGVVLEERGLILKSVGVYPRYFSPANEVVDHVCHVYGAGFLIFGLIIEALVELVRIPDSIVYTQGVNAHIFAVAGAVGLLCAFLSARMCWRLVYLPWNEVQPPPTP